MEMEGGQEGPSGFLACALDGGGALRGRNSRRPGCGQKIGVQFGPPRVLLGRWWIFGTFSLTLYDERLPPQISWPTMCSCARVTLILGVLSTSRNEQSSPALWQHMMEGLAVGEQVNLIPIRKERFSRASEMILGFLRLMISSTPTTLSFPLAKCHTKCPGVSPHVRTNPFISGNYSYIILLSL